MEFLIALLNPDVPFIRYALFAGLLSSVAFGITGTYIMIKHISYLAGAIAHSTLLGIGGALFLRHTFGIQWLTPTIGALISTIPTSLLIGLTHQHAREREDTLISAIWVIGMASGFLLIFGIPVYTDPMTYLFGNILILSRTELIWIAILDVCVVTIALLFYHHMNATIFDEEFSRLRGVPTNSIYILLLLLSALTIVLMITIVGIIMVIALMTLPAAIGSLLAKHLWSIMLIAIVLTSIFCVVGLWISYEVDLPSGSMIILVTGFTYLTVVGIRTIKKRKGTIKRPSIR